MTHKQSIIQQLKAGDPLTDAQLKSRLKATHQTINQACRQLEAAGLITRGEGPDGHIVNRLVHGAEQPVGFALETRAIPRQSHVERGAAFQQLAAHILSARFGCMFRLEEALSMGRRRRTIGLILSRPTGGGWASARTSRGRVVATCRARRSPR